MRRLAVLSDVKTLPENYLVLLTGRNSKGKLAFADEIAKTAQKSVFVVNLSSIVSKYIGETEKNLRQVLDAAQQTGYILYFDEADALFGKRSKVEDSHDMYDSVLLDYKGPVIFAADFRSDMSDKIKAKRYCRFPRKRS